MKIIPSLIENFRFCLCVYSVKFFSFSFYRKEPKKDVKYSSFTSLSGLTRVFLVTLLLFLLFEEKFAWVTTATTNIPWSFTAGISFCSNEMNVTAPLFKGYRALFTGPRDWPFWYFPMDSDFRVDYMMLVFSTRSEVQYDHRHRCYFR